eukprot:4267769-Amphidinium_carterae.1
MIGKATSSQVPHMGRYEVVSKRDRRHLNANINAEIVVPSHFDAPLVSTLPQALDYGASPLQVDSASPESSRSEYDESDRWRFREKRVDTVMSA